MTEACLNQGSSPPGRELHDLGSASSTAPSDIAMDDLLGVIGVIGVAAQIAKTLVNLSLDWQDAPSDIKDFLSELQTLKCTLSESNANIILNPDFTSAFEGRHSAVLSQFGKDALPLMLGLWWTSAGGGWATCFPTSRSGLAGAGLGGSVSRAFLSRKGPVRR